LRLPKAAGGVSPTYWLAGALVVIAIAWYLAWWLTDAVDDWAPDAGVSALSIAATITIVERIVRRESRRRLEPRTQPLSKSIGEALRDFLVVIAIDYGSTHQKTLKAAPVGTIAMLDFWLSERSSRDAPPPPVAGEALSMMMVQARSLAKQLELFRDRDREIMEPELVRAIDEFVSPVRGAVFLYSFDDEDFREQAQTTVVERARRFAEVFLRDAPEWREHSQLP
jgi:hypothetical protein